MFFNHYSELSADCQEVLGAAKVLDVTEFRLFEVAYQDWFGYSGAEGELEKIYAMYWFTGVVPSWVRHYCRQILTLSGQVGHEVQLVAGSRSTKFESVTLCCLALSVLLLLVVF